MTTHNSNQSELMDLLSAVWDESLDPAGRERLEELLQRDDTQAVEELHAFTRLHLDLEWLSSSKSAQEKAFKSLQQVVLAEKKKQLAWPSRRAAGIAALAAGLMFVMFSYFSSSPTGHHELTRTPQPIGQFVRSQGAVWNGDGPLPGELVREGQVLELRQGFAQISMGYGADILLEAPCRAKLAASDLVTLQSGSVAVRAAKWAVGFKVETDDLLATDLGTWFSVEAGGGKASQVHVREGLVLAKPLRDTRPNSIRRVEADQAVHTTQAGALQSIKYRNDPAAAQLNTFHPLRPVPIWNTGIDLQEGEKDPHWFVIAGEDESGPYPAAAVVGPAHGSHAVNEPDQSQWISVDRGLTDGVPARSIYTFETTFDLSGFDLSTVTLFGQILADDGVESIWLNGKQLDVKRWKDWGYGATYVRFRPVEIRDGFIPGLNRISIVVKNETYITRTDRGFDVPNVPNPMALRAEWQGFGRPLEAAGEN
jgi:hypothetical protein